MRRILAATAAAATAAVLSMGLTAADAQAKSKLAFSVDPAPVSAQK